MSVAYELERPAFAIVRRCRPWTQSDDNRLKALLSTGMKYREISYALDRTEIAVKDRRRYLGLAGRKEPRWTPEEENSLIVLLEEHRGYDEIAKALGRSRHAVIDRCFRLGVNVFNANGRTLGAVARLMGVEIHVISRWSSQGWLRSHRTGVRMGKHNMVIVEDDDLLEFLESEDYWHLWEPERIKDREMREWALEQRRGLRFLTTSDVGKVIGLTHHGVNLRIRKGWIRAVKKGFNWLIRSDWVQASTPAKASCGKPPSFTDRELAFIRRWWGSRPASWIAAELGGRSGTGVAKAAERMGLAAFGRGYWKRHRG